MRTLERREYAKKMTCGWLEKQDVQIGCQLEQIREGMNKLMPVSTVRIPTTNIAVLLLQARPMNVPRIQIVHTGLSDIRYGRLSSRMNLVHVAFLRRLHFCGL